MLSTLEPREVHLTKDTFDANIKKGALLTVDQSTSF